MNVTLPSAQEMMLAIVNLGELVYFSCFHGPLP